MSSSDKIDSSIEGTNSTVSSAPIPMGLLPHNSSVFVTNEETLPKSYNGGISTQESVISDTFSDGSGDDAGSGYGSDGYGSGGYASDDTQPKSIYTNIVPVEKMINGWKNLSQWCMTGANSLKDKAMEGWQSTKEFRENSWEYTKEGTRAGWAKTKEVTSASWKATKETANNVSEKLKSAILPNRPSSASNLDSSPSSSDPSSPLSTSPLSSSPLTTQLNSPQSFSPPLSPRTSTDQKEKGGMMIMNSNLMNNNANINMNNLMSNNLNHTSNNNNNNNKRNSAKDSPLLEEVDDYNV